MNIETLTRIGGSEWKVEGKHRIYFNEKELTEFFGLTYEYCKSKNSKCAMLDGEEISKNQAHKIVSGLGFGKFWYDVISGKFEFTFQGTSAYPSDVMAKKIVAEIARRVEAEEAAALV